MTKNQSDRSFGALVAARAVITLGLQGQAVAVAWYIYELTKDALYLGLIGLCEFIPALILATWAGTIVDRKARHLLYRNAIAVSALVPLGLLLVASGESSGALSKSSTIAFVLGLMGLSGLARAFLSPAGVALTGELVPRSRMVKASAWITSAWQMAIVVGPALGGFAYSLGGAVSAFSISIFFHIISLMLAMGIRSTLPAQAAGFQPEPFFEGTRRAWRFLRGDPRLFGAVLLDMLAVLFGGAVALLPIFAERLGVGSTGLGFLRAAPAMGSMLMALVVLRRPPAKNTGAWLMTCVAGFGVSTLIFAFSNHFILSFIALFMTGLFDSVSVIIRGTLLQLLTPDSIKGRVSALNSIFINSSNELGAFESGITAKLFGAVYAAALGGALTLLVVLVFCVKFPELRRASLKDIESN